MHVDLNEIKGLAEHDRSTWRSIDAVAAELRINRFTALALLR